MYLSKWWGDLIGGSDDSLALIDLSAIVLESLKSGYVDSHDLNEAKQPRKLYIAASG